jgi:hypothetical protein
MLGLQAKLGRHGQANYLDAQVFVRSCDEHQSSKGQRCRHPELLRQTLKLTGRREARSMPLRGARAPCGLVVCTQYTARHLPRG